MDSLTLRQQRWAIVLIPIRYKAHFPSWDQRKRWSQSGWNLKLKKFVLAPSNISIITICECVACHLSDLMFLYWWKTSISKFRKNCIKQMNRTESYFPGERNVTFILKYLFDHRLHFWSVTWFPHTHTHMRMFKKNLVSVSTLVTNSWMPRQVLKANGFTHQGNTVLTTGCEARLVYLTSDYY